MHVYIQSTNSIMPYHSRVCWCSWPNVGTAAARRRRRDGGAARSGRAAAEPWARETCWPRRPRLRPAIAAGTGSAGRSTRTGPRNRCRRLRRVAGRRTACGALARAADTRAADTGGRGVRPAAAAAAAWGTTTTARRPSDRGGRSGL